MKLGWLRLGSILIYETTPHLPVEINPNPESVLRIIIPAHHQFELPGPRPKGDGSSLYSWAGTSRRAGRDRPLPLMQRVFGWRLHIFPKTRIQMYLAEPEKYVDGCTLCPYLLALADPGV